MMDADNPVQVVVVMVFILAGPLFLMKVRVQYCNTYEPCKRAARHVMI